MRPLNNFMHRLLALLLLWIVPAGAQSQESVRVEPWERRLNGLQPPDKIMDAVGIKPGMIIGEVGAGEGRMTVWLAERVGDDGKVYANDINEESLKHLNRRCEGDAIGNIQTVLGEVEHARLPKNTLDIAFMINVYHHLARPVPLIKSVRPSLKPGGLLAIVDRDPEKSGGAGNHNTPRERLIRQVESSGFVLEREETFLEEDNIYIFKRDTIQ